MKKRALILAMIAFIAATTSEPSINMVRAEETQVEETQVEETQTEENAGQTSELPIKTLTPKVMDVNPYMAASDSNIHHDCYNTDSTDEVLPVDIYSEINVSYEKVNPNASPAVFFDSYGHSVVPLLGGLAIRDINADEAQTLGYFSPKQHDNGSYLIQSSYSFVDESNRIVCPTNDNRVLMLKATDEEGNVLPEFEKVLDIDIKAAAEAALGKTLDQNLLSVVFDYEGNLWFATGGFRIYPDRKQQGTFGYVSRAAIDKILNGEDVDLSDAVFVYELEPGEGAENGIAASKEGAVILTNLKCYLLQADNGVKKVWETSYKSCGEHCAECQYLSKCTESKDHIKLITRHVWEEYMEVAEDIRHTIGNRQIYQLRKETIERIFGTAKEQHGFRYTQYVGKARMEMKAGLTFAYMNLKKLAKVPCCFLSG
jgi:hypothetical protein